MARSRWVVAALAAVMSVPLIGHHPAVVAQLGCLADPEPNDTEAHATAVRGAYCVAGTLPDGDQDLTLWEVGDEDLRTRWRITLDGVPGTLTILRFFPVTSEPGQTPVAVRSVPVLDVNVTPDQVGPTVVDDRMLPVGRYLVGASRSDQPGRGEPTVPSYGYRIEPGSPFPLLQESEPNDDEATATAVADVFEAGGDLAGSSDDVYAWTVSEPGRWDIDVRAPLEQTVSIEVTSAEGRLIGDTSGHGATLYDRSLEAGTYLIRLGPRADSARPYVLRALPTDAQADPEPNDETVDGVDIADAIPVTGRLAGHDDRDRYRLAVPAGDERLRDVRVLWRSDAERTICLLDAADERLICRRGAGGVTLANLLLAPGTHTLEVSGPPDPADPYLMRVDTTSAPAGDFEAEPNDDAVHATRLDPALGMRGRGAEEDADWFLLRTEGEPQLWSIEFAGADLRHLALVRPDGSELADAQYADDRTSGALHDLYLVPGDHLLVVRSAGAAYTLSGTALGPPDPDGEREPNSEPGRAERYRVGTRRSGRVPDATDRDFLRLTVAAPQHVELDLVPPADAVMGMRLWLGDAEISDLRGLPSGEPISHDVWLRPGDYLIELFAEQPSEERYELTSRRLDPYALRADQEPNDEPAWASPLPPSLSWSGDAVDPDDVDWYAIPPLPHAGPIRIDAAGADVDVALGLPDEEHDFVRYLEPERRDDGSLVVSDAPVDVPLLLSITAAGAYEVAIEAPGSVAHQEVETPPVTLTWRLDGDEVAAYWPEQQVLAGELQVTNGGDEPLDLRLEASTTHYLWRAALGQTDVTVPPHATLGVPVRILAGPDAWGQESVLVSARATTADGGQVSAGIELAARGDAAPLPSRLAWPLPDELLGGLNVASLALGGASAGTIDPDAEPALFDGLTPDGGGFRVYLGDVGERLPIDLVVDLAGDEPLPVAGTILNPQAGEGELAEMARDVEMLLSRDGATWESVWRGSLSALPMDQPFVLPEPVPATHAMLRVHDKQTGDRGGYLELGEWKVVAEPGTPAPAEPLDLAEAVRGGHVVSLSPFTDDEGIGARLLDEDQARDAVALEDEQEVEIIVGFQDGRAPSVTSLGWTDAAGSDAAERLASVEVSLSMRGPLGPWQPVGTWDLARAADGSVRPFTFGRPTWMRYLRLSGTTSADARSLELPGALRVLERPSGDDYRSILAEWGYRSSAGPHEWLGTTESIDWDLAVDAGDSLADATDLTAGALAIDRAEIDVDEDWYRLEIPTGDNTLEVVVDGRPTVGVRLSLVDTTTGSERPMAFELGEDGKVHFQARVDPGVPYAIGVRQPPFSAVFAVDTSGSIDPFLDLVVGGVRSFLGDVRPGREVVNIVPFDEPPLLDDWEDDPYLLRGTFDNHVVEGGGSSSVETALIDSADLLRDREGARAILLVTDAETSSYDATPALWERLSAVRPIIFAVHIGAVEQPAETRQRMQDWAMSGGGVYAYPSTAGEMDRAFERMATWLRRPAAYTLMYDTSSVVLDPGLLSVRPPAGGSRPAMAPGVGVELILDTSGSMLERVDGRTRIDVAKDALESVVRDGLDEGIPVALRTFGGKGKSKGRKAACGTTLTLPLRPLEKSATMDLIRKLRIRKTTSTPIGAALAAVADDLSGVTGPRTVVLVTDGEETCDGDPLASIEALRASGLDVHINIVGFELEDDATRASMAAWATSGGGAYFDAAGTEGLADAISAAVSAPFLVRGPDDSVVASGTVGGGPARLDPGTYEVEVLVDPPVTFSEVVVGGGASVELVLPTQEG